VASGLPVVGGDATRRAQAGVDAGVFTVTSVRLASYAILDLGVGVSAWYRETGEHSEDTTVWQYGEFALPLVGARP
jgi:Tetracyclin repressor-like, C-terminal domain